MYGEKFSTLGWMCVLANIGSEFWLSMAHWGKFTLYQAHKLIMLEKFISKGVQKLYGNLCEFVWVHKRSIADQKFMEITHNTLSPEMDSRYYYLNIWPKLWLVWNLMFWWILCFTDVLYECWAFLMYFPWKLFSYEAMNIVEFGWIWLN